MNRLALATGGLLLLTLGAFAQDQPPPPAPDAAATDMAAPPPPPPGAEQEQADEMAPPPPPRGKGPREERGPRRGRDGDRGPPPPPSKAAHFRLEKGDMKVDVKCADDEPAKACAEITLQLIDRIAPKP